LHCLPQIYAKLLLSVYIESSLAGRSIKTKTALGGFSAGGRWPKLLDQEIVALDTAGGQV
jgi:hypothetical protein